MIASSGAEYFIIMWDLRMCCKLGCVTAEGRGPSPRKLIALQIAC